MGQDETVQKCESLLEGISKFISEDEVAKICEESAKGLRACPFCKCAPALEPYYKDYTLYEQDIADALQSGKHKNMRILSIGKYRRNSVGERHFARVVSYKIHCSNNACIAGTGKIYENTDIAINSWNGKCTIVDRALTKNMQDKLRQIDLDTFQKISDILGCK